MITRCTKGTHNYQTEGEPFKLKGFGIQQKYKCTRCPSVFYKKVKK